MGADFSLGNYRSIRSHFQPKFVSNDFFHKPCNKQGNYLLHIIGLVLSPVLSHRPLVKWIGALTSVTELKLFCLIQESGEFAEGLPAWPLPLRVPALPSRRPAEGPNSNGPLRPVRTVRPSLPAPPILFRRLLPFAHGRPQPATHDDTVPHPDVPTKPQHGRAHLSPPDTSTDIPQPQPHTTAAVAVATSSRGWQGSVPSDADTQRMCRRQVVEERCSWCGSSHCTRNCKEHLHRFFPHNLYWLAAAAAVLCKSSPQEVPLSSLNCEKLQEGFVRPVGRGHQENFILY